MATKFSVLPEFDYWAIGRTPVKVSLYVRVSVKGKRHYAPVNKKRVYPEGTVFCLRYDRKWKTLNVTKLTAALAARATEEAALLTEHASAAKAPAKKRVGIDDAIAVYLSNTAATTGCGLGVRTSCRRTQRWRTKSAARWLIWTRWRRN